MSSNQRKNPPLAQDKPDPGDVRVKDLKTSRRERTPTSLNLIRDDFHHLRDDVLNMFKSAPAQEKPAKALSLLRDEFSSFKDDLSSVFRRSLTGDKVKTGKVKTLRDPGTPSERFKSPFRDQTLLKSFQRARNKKMGSGESGERSGNGVRENVPEPRREDMDGRVDGDDGKPDVNVADAKTKTRPATRETTDTEETRASSCTAKQRRESEAGSIIPSENSADDDKINEGEVNFFLSFPLSTGIKLFSPRDADEYNNRNRPEHDVWSIKNFAGYLTIDPNTANADLSLTDSNRTATRVWPDHPGHPDVRPVDYPDHPERFEYCPQVLCREGLLDTFYWEATWSGGADIGIAYNSICRDGDASSCLLGHNERSWSLECSEGNYTPCHNNRRFKSSSPQPFSHRVGVFLDWAAGSLSFYSISQDAMVHLHTFTSTFTEPLYPGFWVWACDGSVSLRQVELDWERLLQ